VSQTRSYPTTSRLDRITGALLGVHAGDWLGGRSATDATDLTRAVLQAYLNPGDDVVRAVAARLLALFVGVEHASGAGQGPVGNGALLRCLPTAIAVADPKHRISQSVELAAITHADPRCTGSCATYNEIVAALVAGQSPIEAIAIALSVANAHGGGEVVQAVRRGTKLSLPIAAATGQTFPDDVAGGEVLHSLSLAVAAVLDPRPLDAVLADVVELGRISGIDPDATPAIAGGLLGARDGARAIGPGLTAKLQHAAEFEAAAREISAWR
jgi:ADP-ribosylglycohydrolase